MSIGPRLPIAPAALAVCALLVGCTRDPAPAQRSARPSPVARTATPAGASPAGSPGHTSLPATVANPTEATDAAVPTAAAWTDVPPVPVAPAHAAAAAAAPGAPGRPHPVTLAPGIDAGPPLHLDYGEQVAMAFIPISGDLRECYAQAGGDAVPPGARSVWIVVDPAGHVADAGAGGDASAAVQTCMAARVHNLHLPPHPGSHWYGFPLAPPPGT